MPPISCAEGGASESQPGCSMVVAVRSRHRGATPKHLAARAKASGACPTPRSPPPSRVPLSPARPSSAQLPRLSWADGGQRTADGGRQAVRSWMQLRRCLWSRSAAPGPAGARFTALCRRRGAEDGDIPPLLAELPCRCLRTPARRGGTKAGLCCRQPARHGTAWHCFRPLRRPCGVHVGTGLGPRGLCSMGAT